MHSSSSTIKTDKQMTDDYAKFDKNQLIDKIKSRDNEIKSLDNKIKKLKKRKKYGLVWDEEKTEEKFDEQLKNKLPILKEVKSNSISLKKAGLTQESSIDGGGVGQKIHLVTPPTY